VCRGMPSCPWDTCGAAPGRRLVGFLWGSPESMARREDLIGAHWPATVSTVLEGTHQSLPGRGSRWQPGGGSTAGRRRRAFGAAASSYACTGAIAIAVARGDSAIDILVLRARPVTVMGLGRPGAGILESCGFSVPPVLPARALPAPRLR